MLDRSLKSITSVSNSIAFRSFVYQVLLFLLVFAAGWYLYTNVTDNQNRQGIGTGFGFLSAPAGFDIGETIIPFDASQSYARALIVGILNTLYVSFFGITTATMLGVTMGLLSVSDHPIFQRIARAYVEAARNIPLVLQLIFFVAIIQKLPGVGDAIQLLPGVYLSNRGLNIPAPVSDSVYLAIGVAFLVSIVVVIGLQYWARRHREKTGRYVEVSKFSWLIVIGAPFLAWLISGAPLDWNAPVFERFNFQGGYSISPEFIGLLVAISFYGGAYIAEIVRSGIEAVPKGQFEAAKALGIKPRSLMRYVVFPQALRVVIPPVAGSYLSLVKNSSLGVLIGYPDLVSIGNTAMNQTGQAVEAIAIMMVVYLTISLTISTFMNIYNHSSRIRER